MTSPLCIGISACLLGQAVRYDGAHKRHDLLLAEAGAQVRWIAVCPEVELGLGIPREPIELVTTGEVVRLVTVHSKRDLTVTMTAWAARRLDQLEQSPLAGYVLKERSPSCGLAVPGGRGMFAAALLARFPALPVIEAAALADRTACREFLARARAYRDRLFPPA